jgi:hypothetical protein
MGEAERGAKAMTEKFVPQADLEQRVVKLLEVVCADTPGCSTYAEVRSRFDERLAGLVNETAASCQQLGLAADMSASLVALTLIWRALTVLRSTETPVSEQEFDVLSRHLWKHYVEQEE